jgi:hypothetical protein
MFRHEDAYERVIRGESDGPPREGRLPYLGRLTRIAGKRKARKPAPLAPDAKRYDDEIPDPDSEVVVPE